MARQSNVELVLKDDDGLFIRSGAARYRPSDTRDAGGVTRGQTVRAWPVSGSSTQLHVETPRGKAVWHKV